MFGNTTHIWLIITCVYYDYTHILIRLINAVANSRNVYNYCHYRKYQNRNQCNQQQYLRPGTRTALHYA